MQIGYFGLGKMGVGMVTRMSEKGHTVIAYDQEPSLRSAIVAKNVSVVETPEAVVAELSAPRTLWLMVPSGNVDAVISMLVPHLSQGDTIIDGGNSRYTESIRRAEELKTNGIHFIDAGVSGGPAGARNGACIMAGGEKEVVERYRSLFTDLTVPEGFAHVGPSGSGHFVKMVHNGIEYGMMQSIAEGFSLMKAAPIQLSMSQIATLYNKGSVVESRLIGWLEKAFTEYGEDLAPVSGVVAHLGEGQWTIETARAMEVPPLSAIEAALHFRIESGANPNDYRGKILSALRNQFGGHAITATPHA